MDSTHIDLPFIYADNNGPKHLVLIVPKNIDTRIENIKKQKEIVPDVNKTLHKSEAESLNSFLNDIIAQKEEKREKRKFNVTPILFIIIVIALAALIYFFGIHLPF